MSIIVLDFDVTDLSTAPSWFTRSLLQGTAGDMPCASTYALSCRADGLSLDSAAHLFV